ncbi:addiction module antitoxin RelB [Methylomonas koyamae]|uniref:Addiction module antitoxin RelB n=1 Tax=Methylomonas koyamae TaxID=702114 RepID=A0A177NR48_9GAMM|nr:type II toxin-antitoxin system RelE/ParE family toxin [Methylomonas koyamae]OAI19510.1 addiction module antitoxin RelB [Methylomonas koyamae]
MIEIIQSETFKNWLSELKDTRAKARIEARIRRVSLANFGDCKLLKEGVSELRVDYGPGYRVYYSRRGLMVVLLLAGGDKTTQQADIERAIAIAKHWSDQP